MFKKFQDAQVIVLILVIAIYTALGVLYAILTPPWQNPDEPAHYNYVRRLAEQQRFPILQMGDYDQAYLEEIKSSKFDPRYAIDSIRYEFHQPPLYYLVAAPIYAIFGGTLFPLRLLSVLFGVGVLITTYLVGKAVFPAQPWLALGMAAFIAFIPQHVALSAAVENDALAELLIGLVLLGLIRWLQSDKLVSVRTLGRIGIWIGLGLLTKTSAYITVPLAIIAIALKLWPIRKTLNAQIVAQIIISLLFPALLLGLPWFIRNAGVYGGLDILGLQRHEQIVVDQPRTFDLAAKQGWINLLLSWLNTTFHSFWAQFGWMAVPIDDRMYTFLWLFSLTVTLGFCFWLIDFFGQKRKIQPAAILLLCSGLMTLASMIWYNLSFYQAQGRYLFSALISLSAAWILGLNEILRRKNAWPVGIAFAIAAVIDGIRLLQGVCSNKWRLLMTGLGTGAFIIRSFLPEQIWPWLVAATYLPLLALCAASPFLFIVPYLTP